jgi:predicted ATP-grasp superfamily ATP-dependent carboligase
MLVLAGISTRALAGSAIRASYEVQAVDYFGDLDHRQACRVTGLTTDLGLDRPTVEALCQVLDGIDFEGIVYTSPLENHPELVARWEARGLLGNGQHCLARARDHPEFARVLATQGIRTPITIYPGTSRPRHQPPEGPGGLRWLLKPSRGGGGRGVRLVDVPSIPRPGWLLQEFVPGVPASATFLSDGKNWVLLGASRQITGDIAQPAQGFRYAGNVVPLAVPEGFDACQIERQVRQLPPILVGEFGLKGLNTVDFVATEVGISVLEINPRWSASVELLEAAMDLSLFGHHVEACCGSLHNVEGCPALPLCVPGEESPGQFYGKAIVHAQEQGRAQRLDPEAVTRLYLDGVRDIPHPRARMRGGQPVCTVLATAGSHAHCMEQLRRQASLARERCWQPCQD